MARLSIGRIWPFVLVALACCAGVIHGGDCYTGCRNARWWGANFNGNSAIKYSEDICRTGSDCAAGAAPVDCEFIQEDVIQWWHATGCTPSCTGGSCGGFFREFSCWDYTPGINFTDDYKCEEFIDPEEP
jgi:hypothetical protein